MFALWAAVVGPVCAEVPAQYPGRLKLNPDRIGQGTEHVVEVQQKCLTRFALSQYPFCQFALGNVTDEAVDTHAPRDRIYPGRAAFLEPYESAVARTDSPEFGMPGAAPREDIFYQGPLLRGVVRVQQLVVLCVTFERLSGKQAPQICHQGRCGGVPGGRIPAPARHPRSIQHCIDLHLFVRQRDPQLMQLRQRATLLEHSPSLRTPPGSSNRATDTEPSPRLSLQRVANQQQCIVQVLTQVNASPAGACLWWPK